jgi:hypothetical protein
MRQPVCSTFMMRRRSSTVIPVPQPTLACRRSSEDSRVNRGHGTKSGITHAGKTASNPTYNPDARGRRMREQASGYSHHSSECKLFINQPVILGPRRGCVHAAVGKIVGEAGTPLRAIVDQTLNYSRGACAPQRSGLSGEATVSLIQANSSIQALSQLH